MISFLDYFLAATATRRDDKSTEWIKRRRIWSNIVTSFSLLLPCTTAGNTRMFADVRARLSSFIHKKKKKRQKSERGERGRRIVISELYLFFNGDSENEGIRLGPVFIFQIGMIR